MLPSSDRAALRLRLVEIAQGCGESLNQSFDHLGLPRGRHRAARLAGAARNRAARTCRGGLISLPSAPAAHTSALRRAWATCHSERRGRRRLGRGARRRQLAVVGSGSRAALQSKLICSTGGSELGSGRPRSLHWCGRTTAARRPRHQAHGGARVAVSARRQRRVDNGRLGARCSPRFPIVGQALV